MDVHTHVKEGEKRIINLIIIGLNALYAITGFASKTIYN